MYQVTRSYLASPVCACVCANLFTLPLPLLPRVLVLVSVLVPLSQCSISLIEHPIISGEYGDVV